MEGCVNLYIFIPTIPVGNELLLSFCGNSVNSSMAIWDDILLVGTLANNTKPLLETLGNPYSELM